MGGEPFSQNYEPWLMALDPCHMIRGRWAVFNFAQLMKQHPRVLFHGMRSMGGIFMWACYNVGSLN